MKPLLKAENIQFSVKNREKPILSNINLAIYPEDFIILLGHNGSGKTTLLKILAGELTPSGGNISIESDSFLAISNSIKAKQYVTLTQHAENRLFFELTVEENIYLWESRFLPKERLSIPQILVNNQSFINKLKQPVNTLSGGEKQNLLLTLVMAHPPRLLYLDEHTSALDPKAAAKIMLDTARIVEKEKITTIMITHNLDNAIAYGNRLIILKEGGIDYDQRNPRNLNIDTLKKMLA